MVEVGGWMNLFLLLQGVTSLKIEKEFIFTSVKPKKGPPKHFSQYPCPQIINGCPLKRYAGLFLLIVF